MKAYSIADLEDGWLIPLCECVLFVTQRHLDHQVKCCDIRTSVCKSVLFYLQMAPRHRIKDNGNSYTPRKSQSFLYVKLDFVTAIHLWRKMSCGLRVCVFSSPTVFSGWTSRSEGGPL